MKLSITYTRPNYVQSYVTESTIERKVANNQEGDLFQICSVKKIFIDPFDRSNMC